MVKKEIKTPNATIGGKGADGSRGMLGTAE